MLHRESVVVIARKDGHQLSHAGSSEIVKRCGTSLLM